MRREGRQHGAVRCYEISLPLSPRERYRNMVDSASASGLFIKVPNKPTNHSKYTGKCRNARCNGHHLHPVCKSKDKTKGNMKFRSIDHEHEWTKYTFGASATGVLAYLADEDGYNDDDDYDYEGTIEKNYDYYYDYDYDNGYPYTYAYAYDDHDDGTHAGSIETAAVEEHDDDDDDVMSFCDVGLCWGHGDEYGDDGWYMVGGQMQ